MSGREHESYGLHGTTWVDRLGVWLSNRAILRELPNEKLLRVIELGCGYRAAQLVSISERLSEGIGVDFAIAPELRAAPKLRFIEGTIEDALPQLGDSCFDVVLLISVLEHLKDVPEVLVNVHRLLSPGGVLLINVPTWRGKTFLELSAFRLGLSPKVEMDDHKMYYDKRDLWPRLVTAGFSPSKIRLRYHKFGLNLFARAQK